MGFFGKRKSESPSVDEILGMNDDQIKKLIKDKVVPRKSPAQLRKEAKEVKRKTSGETGVGALFDGFRGGGTNGRNHQNIPLKDRVHPAEYKRILGREAKRQGLL